MSYLPFPFLSNILVSLENGRTLGQFDNGDVIASQGLTPEAVVSLLASQDIAPTYTIPTLTIPWASPSKAEVGEPYSYTVTAVFTQNDAGALSQIRLQKNGADITPNGSGSPWSKTDTGSYVLGVITYQAYANYGAGIIKNYTPSGTPDPRTPQVRDPNAPQAASTNFASAIQTLQGAYYVWYDDVAATPTNSAEVRALGNSRFSDAGDVFILNTGTTNRRFSVAVPPGKTLSLVSDLTTSGADITSQYVEADFNVNDAGGTPVAYKIYTMTQAVPYSANHQHQITLV